MTEILPPRLGPLGRISTAISVLMRGDSTDGNGRTEIDWGLVVVSRDIGGRVGVSDSAPSRRRGGSRRHHGWVMKIRMNDDQRDGQFGMITQKTVPALVTI